jgi:hypothetical protein
MSDEKELREFLRSISVVSSETSPSTTVIRRPRLLAIWTVVMMGASVLGALGAVIGLPDAGAFNIFLILLCVANFMIAFALFSGESWSWRAVQWLVGFNIVLSILTFRVGAQGGSPLVRIVAGILLVVYLHTSKVKRFCRVDHDDDVSQHVDVTASMGSL